MIGFLMILVGLGYFKVERVVVNGEELEREGFEEVMGKEGGSSIYGVDMEEVMRNLRRMYMSLDIEIYRRYPDTLEVKIWERKLLGLVRFKGLGGGVWALDEEGVLVGYMEGGVFEEGVLPLIELYGEWELGLGVRFNFGVMGSVIEGLKFLKRVDVDFFNRVREVKIEGGGKNYLVVEGLGLRLRFGKELRRDRLLEVIGVGFDWEGIGGVEGELDLRYEDLVLRKEFVGE